LKMSKGTSPSDSEKSLESWNQLVIKRRGEYSRRLKLALRTRESGSSSWPSPIASEVRQGFQDRSRGMKGSQESLTTAVVKDAANWPTPSCMDVLPPKSQAALNKARTVGGCSNLREWVHHEGTFQLHGQAAPANPSTDGSRQGLWPTPDTQTGPHGARGVSTNPNHQSAKSLEATARTWATPQTRDGHNTSNPSGMKRHSPDLCRQMPLGQKLNPRWVETLMGLPVGWTMPSCASPVTIEPTNYDSSATESCLQPQSELFEF
jgi:hypothetical protein